MTADLTPRERVARAMYEAGWAARRGMVAWESSPWHVRDLDLTRADAALTALADDPGLAEVLWASVDDKGIRGRLYREDCDYLADVVRAWIGGRA